MQLGKRLNRLRGIVCATALLICATAEAAIPASERAALDTLYQQTGGSGWSTRTGWGGASGTECNWYGVSCNSAGDHIVAVVLPYNNLTGSIPPIAGLTQLVAFNVGSNHLTGTLPSLAGLSSLQGFDVSRNDLIGGIPSLAGLVNLQNFFAEYDHLTGSIPSLQGLTKLQGFFVEDNQLTGSIPSLQGLSELRQFNVSENQLSGPLPDLTSVPLLGKFQARSNQLTGPLPVITGFANLSEFDVSLNRLTGGLPALANFSTLRVFSVENNQLTGSVPSLNGLYSLQYFQIGGNGFTGDLPDPPFSLIAGQSTVCNNPVNHKDNGAWNSATGKSPWYTDCTSAPPSLSISTSDSSVATGTQTTINVSIGGPKALTQASTSKETGTITDDKGNVVCYITLSNGAGSCNTVLPSGTSNLTAGYSGNLNLAPASTGLSKTTPVTTPGNLNQHGWTGTWYNPATGGQGIVFEVYPDVVALGTGLIGGGWFTFDFASGGEEAKRWYTLQGPVASNSSSTTLQIYASVNGNFNAGPVINAANGLSPVGTAKLSFTDCQHGILNYRITTPASRAALSYEPEGDIPLTRLDSNVTCNPTNGAGNGTAPGKFLLSGAWYTPSTSGQGVLFDINPVQNISVAAWYTYAPNGQSIGGGASQRWYTLQIGSANVGTAPLNNIGIYSAQGGTFNAPGGVTTPQVGTASIAFNNCNSLVLNYNFTAGTNAGQSGTINLQRAGPTPAGCSL